MLFVENGLNEPPVGGFAFLASDLEGLGEDDDKILETLDA